MINTKWKNTWDTDGRRYWSDLGWEIKRHTVGQQFALYKNGVMHSIQNSISDAKDLADDEELDARRVENGTGNEAHEIVEGRGGLWDINIAVGIAKDKAAEQIKAVRDIADNSPNRDDLPVLCVPIEIIRDGQYVYREYILTNSEKAKAQFATENYFEAIYLTFEEAEVARVADITDTPEARSVTRRLRKTPARYEPKRGVNNPWRRSIGDPLAFVRKHAGL